MEKLGRYRGYIVLTLVYGVLFGGYVAYERWPRPEPIEIAHPTAVPTSAPTMIPAATSAVLQVHVVGAVQRPGVYALPSGSRMIQAVEAAGGFTEEADQDQVNLADRLVDGYQLVIRKRGTVAISPPTLMPSPSSSVMPGPTSPSGQRLVNINTATVAELDTLPGIGPTYAQRIVAYRESHGPFGESAQIMRVEGIGQAIYDRIRDRITVR